MISSIIDVLGFSWKTKEKQFSAFNHITKLIIHNNLHSNIFSIIFSISGQRMIHLISECTDNSSVF